MFKPLQDKVLVSRTKEKDTTEGGIIIPDKAKKKQLEGIVMAVGAGNMLKDGTVRPLDVKKGDRVLFEQFVGSDITLNGEDFVILKESELLGVKEV